MDFTFSSSLVPDGQLEAGRPVGGDTHTGSPPTSLPGLPILGARRQVGGDTHTGIPWVTHPGSWRRGGRSPVSPLCGLRVNELSEDKAGASSSAEGGGPRPSSRPGVGGVISPRATIGSGTTRHTAPPSLSFLLPSSPPPPLWRAVSLSLVNADKVTPGLGCHHSLI